MSEPTLKEELAKKQEQEDDRIMRAIRRVAKEREISVDFVLDQVLKRTEKTGEDHEQAIKSVWGYDIREAEGIKKADILKEAHLQYSPKPLSARIGGEHGPEVKAMRERGERLKEAHKNYRPSYSSEGED